MLDKGAGRCPDENVTCGYECTLTVSTGQLQVASNPEEVEELALMT
jgi:hypothetical protein